MLCGNDVIERYFGNLRMKYGHCSIDNLELIFATRAMQLCTDMTYKHPEWFKHNRSTMQRLCLDYSNPKDWKKERLILRDIDLLSVWNTGRAVAEQNLNKFPKYQGDVSDFTQLALQGFTLLILHSNLQLS